MPEHLMSAANAARRATAPAHYYLRWPPPGLEQQQAAAWPVILALSVGSALLVLPQLIVLTAPAAPWSIGPFEPVWPLPILCSIAGTVLVLGAAFRLAWVLAAGARAARHGYGWITFTQVVTDVTRDTGFIIQGARDFGTLDATARRRVLALRLASAGCYLAAALWPLVGFTTAYLLVIRDIGGARLLWLLTLFPAVALTIAGLACRALERIDLSAPRRSEAERTDASPELRSEIDEWTARLDDEVDAGALPQGRRLADGAFGAAALTGMVITMIAVLPVAALSILAAIGPMLTGAALPGYGTALTQLRLLELYDEYRVPVDPAIDAAAAGQALHALSFAGVAAPGDGVLRAPARSWPDAIVPRAVQLPEPFTGVNWGPGLLAAAARGLDAQQRDYLEIVAAQPYQADIARFARAGAADIGGARWASPMPAHLAAHEWPMPRFATTRDVFHARYALAALALADGRLEDGEAAIREVLSAGLLLAADGVLALDGVIGASIAHTAAHMLREFYELAGRTTAAARLDATLRAADLARATIRPLPPNTNSIASLPPIVLDTTIARSLRWEIFGTLTSVDGCLTPRRAVFGAESDAAEWRDRARRRLVRYPADAERFAILAQHGQFGRPEGRRTVLERAVTAAAGRPRGMPGCSEVLAALSR